MYTTSKQAGAWRYQQVAGTWGSRRDQPEVEIVITRNPNASLYVYNDIGAVCAGPASRMPTLCGVRLLVTPSQCSSGIYVYMDYNQIASCFNQPHFVRPFLQCDQTDSKRHKGHCMKMGPCRESLEELPHFINACKLQTRLKNMY